MLCLPPHTTHEAQPLDCGVFGPLNTHWSHVCHAYLQQNPGPVMTCFQFNTLFSQAWSAAVSPANIIAGFRTCGVYPFNPSAICVSACNSDYEDGTGSSFLLLYHHHRPITCFPKKLHTTVQRKWNVSRTVLSKIRHLVLVRSQKNRSVGFAFAMRKGLMSLLIRTMSGGSKSTTQNHCCIPQSTISF